MIKLPRSQPVSISWVFGTKKKTQRVFLFGLSTKYRSVIGWLTYFSWYIHFFDRKKKKTEWNYSKFGPAISKNWQNRACSSCFLLAWSKKMFKSFFFQWTYWWTGYLRMSINDAGDTFISRRLYVTQDTSERNEWYRNGHHQQKVEHWSALCHTTSNLYRRPKSYISYKLKFRFWYTIVHFYHFVTKTIIHEWSRRYNSSDEDLCQHFILFSESLRVCKMGGYKWLFKQFFMLHCVKVCKNITLLVAMKRELYS